MRPTLAYIICGCLSALLAGSVTLNVLQLREHEELNLRKDRAGFSGTVAELRRTGAIVRVDPGERSVTVSYTNEKGQGEALKAYLKTGTSIQRVVAVRSEDGMVTSLQFEPIPVDQLRAGDDVYVVVRHIVEKGHFEANVVWTGDLLPLPR